MLKKFLVGLLFALGATIPVSLHGQNLIINGGFENDIYKYGEWPIVDYINPGFTSDYSSHHPSDLYKEGSYAIGTAPSSGNNNFVNPPRNSFDTHDVTGEGNMLIVNGATGETALDDIVWQSNRITVDINTEYAFELHAININKSDWTGWKETQAILEFQVLEGNEWVSIGQLDFTNPETDSTVWNYYSHSWISRNNTTAQLRLINHQTAANGNDFAIDGISFHAAGTIPEPGALFLMALGLFPLLRRRRLAKR